MDTDTSSKPLPEPSAFDELEAALAAGDDECILFALHLPDLERVAWREGRARALAWEREALEAFAQICRRTLRSGDAVAHEAGTNLFLVALLEPSATADIPRTARAVLGEIVRRFARETGFEARGGWTLYKPGGACARSLREAATAALERGERERERYAFFAALGHEMRTPLMSVEGYLAVLGEGNLDAATRRRFTEMAQTEAARLRRLVESMFALSLADLDAELVRDAACDVQHAVERACDAIYPAAAARGARVRVCSRVDGTVPLALERAVQTFTILLENAIKHGRENGRVEIRLEERPGHVLLFFDDDGSGVAAGERDEIFEPLVRGRSVAAAGHGLGLSIARAAIERAGGDIEALPSPLGGARFAVRLPRANVASLVRERRTQ